MSVLLGADVHVASFQLTTSCSASAGIFSLVPCHIPLHQPINLSPSVPCPQLFSSTWTRPCTSPLQRPHRHPEMGNCFSDPSKPSSSGQKLGSGPTPSQPTSGSAPSRPAQPAAPPRTLGGADYGTSGEGVPLGVDERDARDRALRAAEERAKAVSAAASTSTTCNATMRQQVGDG